MPSDIVFLGVFSWCVFLVYVAYYVAFGPHGPRTPSSQPGDALKILLYTSALIGVAGTLFFAIRNMGTCLFCCLKCEIIVYH